ncbi:hypothetical protein [Actinoplanes sp. NPDC049265]|uniref:hypothetical protein n=1 Tax=Actinoplanes sp. NPDC049265 TaxID=3363902 RepID=UPI0037221BE0
MMSSPSPAWPSPDDLPEEWEPPEELMSPTPYAEVNLSIRLLSCDFLNFQVRDAIGRFVSEEALYDVWFLENVENSGWGTRKTAILREFPMERTRDVYEAWLKLDGINELNVPAEQEYDLRMTAMANLEAALRRAAEQFAGVRAGTLDVDCPT